MLVKRLLQRFGLHDLGVTRRSMGKGANPVSKPVRIGVDQQIKPELCHSLVSEFDHLAKLPGCVDMQEPERRLCRIERLQRQMQHHCAVLADGIEKHGIFGFGRDLAKNLHRLGLKQVESGYASVLVGSGGLCIET